MTTLMGRLARASMFDVVAAQATGGEDSDKKDCLAE
jgi:hypothetical protein